MASSLVKKYTYQVLFLTWISYAASYVLRKPLSIIKPNLISDLGFTEIQLGYLDSAFLLPYAGSQLFMGAFMDKIGARRMLAIGLWGSALSSFSVGWHSSFFIFLILTFLNGFFQSMHWSNCVKGNAPWLRERNRSTVLGIWGTCQSLGGVLGSYVAVCLVASSGWRSVFFWPSVMVTLVGVLVYLFLVTPEDVGIQAPNSKYSIQKHSSSGETSDTMSFFEVLSIPKLKSVILGFFCVKLTRYALMLWLPMYFKNELNFDLSTAGMLATTFEIGGALGSPFTGALVDRFFGGRKYFATCCFLFLSAGFLYIFVISGGMGILVNSFLMIAVGIFSCGPDSIITGPITLDLSEASGKKNVQATVAGTINGLGGLGSVFQGPLVGYIYSLWGWLGVMYSIVGLTFFAGVLLVPVSLGDKGVDQYDSVSMVDDSRERP